MCSKIFGNKRYNQQVAAVLGGAGGQGAPVLAFYSFLRHSCFLGSQVLEVQRGVGGQAGFGFGFLLAAFAFCCLLLIRP